MTLPSLVFVQKKIMKQIIHCLCFIFCYVNPVFSQVYEIEYIFQTSNVLPVMKGAPNELRVQMAKILQKESKRKHIFSLYYCNGRSKYVKLPYTIMDGEKDFDSRKQEGYGETYKDFIEGYYVLVADFIGKNTAVKDKFEDIFNWQIESIQDTIIAGFLCYKATTKYNEKTIVAWFTKKIPISDGPFRYAGLPGLIIEIETSFGVTKVSDIKIIKGKNEEEIIIPKKKKYISFKEMKESRTLTVKGKRIKKKE